MVGGMSMPFPRPVDRFGRDGAGNPPLIELTLGLIEPITALEEGERQPAGSRLRRPVAGFRRLVGVVEGLQPVWKALYLGPIERRQAMSDLESWAACRPGGPEPDRPLDGASERTVATAPMPKAELAGDVEQVDVGDAATTVERIGEMPEQQRGGWAEHAEPELFDVTRSGIVAELIDQRVVPAQEVQRVRCRSRRFGVDASSGTRGGVVGRHDVPWSWGDEPGKLQCISVSFIASCQGAVAIPRSAAVSSINASRSGSVPTSRLA